MIIPPGLQGFFSTEHFNNYPKISLPQQFIDNRGTITNIADGSIGDVAVISSIKGAIRANHFHESDWHLTFMISGSMTYLWKQTLDSDEFENLICSSGDLVYTPPCTPHKMVFLENSTFIAVSALSRSQANYELDTQRLPDNFFDGK